MLVLLAIFGCSAPQPTEPTVASVSPASTEPRPCVECHAEQVRAWEGSHHALAERELDEGDAWARELGAVRVIGVHPLQQGLVPADGGRLQAHSMAWDVELSESFPLHTDGRQPGDWGHWTGGGLTWNGRCAACHVTGVDKGLQPDGSYSTRFDALGVTCEACHGDASTHAAGGPPPENAEMDATCAACHARRAELGVPIEPGVPLLDMVMPVLVDDPVFRADGLGLDEVFSFTNFAASGMHAGGARCNDCHDVHSGRLLAEGDALCDRCHDQLPQQDHPTHPEGVACVDCHMPTLTVMQRHPRRDHGFSSPREGMEPDPCAGCHAEHPAQAAPDPQDLAFERVRQGGPLGDLDLEPPNRWRRAAILRLLAGRPEAEPVVERGLSSPDPLIRAAAAGSWESPRGMGPLQPLLDDPVRAVRVAAQRSWVAGGGSWDRATDYARYLDHNADDALTLAERGLRRISSGDGGGLEDLTRAATADPGSPDVLIAASIGLARMGRLKDGVKLLAEGVQRHPDDAEVWWNYAIGLAGLKRDAEAIEALHQVLERRPDDARAARNLALLYKRSDDPRFAAALRRALALNPGDRELAAWAASLPE